MSVAELARGPLVRRPPYCRVIENFPNWQGRIAIAAANGGGLDVYRDRA